MRRKFLSILIAVLIGLTLVFLPALVLAQAPCPFGNDFSSDPGYATITDMYWNGDYFDDINVEGQPTYDDINERLEVYIPPGGQTNRGGASFIIPFIHTVEYGDAITVWAASAHPTASPYLIVKYSDDTYSATGPHVNGSWTLELSTATFSLDVGKTIVEIHLNGSHFGIFGGGNVYFDDLSANFCNDEEIDALCPLVANSHFASDIGWFLSDGASITTSILSLPVDGIAAQNLTLASNTDYNAVISTTGTVSGSTTLSVILGMSSETIEINSAGLFTASFRTPTLGGPIAYGLENVGENAIDLDFTCVYLATEDGGAATSECLAPINGTFETADNWTYIRDATWYSPAKEASLPYANTALIVSTSLYSLPTLTTGEHLLLSFSSRKLDDTQTGGVMGRAKSGASSAAFTYEVFPTDYTFETNIDAVAGLDNVELAFVNPGLEGSPIFSGTSDIAIDNICVFTATRGANLPAPNDPNGITPVDLGFNWTSCSQTDGIMAGFGVNMAQYRADYSAGASVWDPIGWVPWLISALWMNLAAWLCVFMAAFVTLIDVLEYIINNILNIAGWIIRSWPAMVQWLGQWGNWLGNTLAGLSNAYGNFLAAWADWIGTGLAYISGVIGLTLAAVAEWLGNSLANLSSWLGSTLAALWGWLSTYLLNLNGLRTIANWIIAAWNLYLSTLGAVLSALIQVAVDVWDSTIYPVLQAIWDYLAGFSLVSLIAGTAVSFVGAAFDLFWMIVQWIWANVVMMVNLPFQLYYGFNSGVQSEAFSALIACSSENWFCSFLAGVQIINQTVGATILYPIVIAGIILATLGIFWKNI